MLRLLRACELEAYMTEQGIRLAGIACLQAYTPSVVPVVLVNAIRQKLWDIVGAGTGICSIYQIIISMLRLYRKTVHDMSKIRHPGFF